MNIDQHSLRQTLGCFATGVCVITTTVEGAPPIGMTVNSFAAVSLDPALVLWSLQKNSDCFDYFDQSDLYAVNILAYDQQAISNSYAIKNAHDLAPASYRMGRNGCPVLKNTIAHLECRVSQRLEGGDHIILLAEVLGIESKQGAKPLVFYAGKYRELK